jgi:hypothetical protein
MGKCRVEAAIFRQHNFPVVVGGRRRLYRSRDCLKEGSAGSGFAVAMMNDWRNNKIWF